MSASPTRLIAFAPHGYAETRRWSLHADTAQIRRSGSCPGSFVGRLRRESAARGPGETSRNRHFCDTGIHTETDTGAEDSWRVPRQRAESDGRPERLDVRGQGEEDLTAQGQTNAASYRATVQLTQRPETLHSQGVSVSKGKDRSEEIFVTGNTAYLKETGQSWQHGPVSEPEMQSKVEDPLAGLEAFRTYLRDPAVGVTLTRSACEVELRVRASSKKFSAVWNQGFMEKVRAELDSTMKQLEKAGVPVNEQQFTLSSLQETLTLDSVTHRIVSHRFQFGVVIPYGQQGITYSQDVQEDARGVFGGDIRPPAGVK